MANIRILPETVQNMIAAGEVVERPASVVKELVENAIDAGAADISVELEDGGHRLIRVADDGCGMSEDDLILAVQRHATSKIEGIDDIYGKIRTMGFRGEALPSIASVSRMTIRTAESGAEAGREYVLEGGHSVRLSAAPPRKGTVVEVRDLFFNTPARRKFLKRPESENTQAAVTLTRIALANPGLGLRLQTGPRLSLAVHPAESQGRRIIDLFGKTRAGRIIPIAREVDAGISVSGHIVPPPGSEKTSRQIFLFVNGRWIHHPGMVRAVRDAFRTVLPPHSYPFAVVNLALDPARVDVNVHPAKIEVRFDNEDVVVRGVVHAIKEALATIAAAPTFYAVDPPASAPRSGERSRFSAWPANDFSRADLASIRERLRGGRPLPVPAVEPEALPTAETPASGPGDAAGAATLPFGAEGIMREAVQLGGRYVVVESAGGLIFIDPHALHERWNFDRLVEERRRGGAARRLLMPVEVELSAAEIEAAVEAAPLLAEYGFELRKTAPNRVEIVAAPAHLASAGLEPLLRQILSDLDGAESTLQSYRGRLLASLACRSAVLLGRNLPREELDALLDNFYKTGQLPSCPHGRPTAIRISWDELDRRFGR